MTMLHSPSHSRRRRAFTLVEMLIVVGIIILLAALVVAVSAALSSQSEVRVTEMLLKRLDVALQEWETAADRQLTWGENGMDAQGGNDTRARYDMQIDTPHIVTLTEMLRTVGKPAAVKESIGQLTPEQVYRYRSQGINPPWIAAPDPNDPDAASQAGIDTWVANTDNILDDDLAILDAWQKPVRAVHPGRLWIQGYDANADRDEDGTIRTDLEKIYGVARNRRAFFVSAGPDGKFGSRDPNAIELMRDFAEDNVYSYEVKQP
jgi:type II secretory pathway pseudopilin PulG